MAKKSGGRPVKDQAEKRVRQLPPARVTDAELITAQANAAAARLSLSDFIRQAATTGRVVPRRPSTDDRTLAALNRIGVNLHQLVRHLNYRAPGPAPVEPALLLAQLGGLLDQIARGHDGP